MQSSQVEPPSLVSCGVANTPKRVTDTLNGRTVVVAGATGNVGPFIVRALLEREATVAVPSRSEAKLEGLWAHVRRQVAEADLARLHTFVVIHAFIRDRRTQPGSPLSGEEVGVFAAHLLATGEEVHGQSIELRSSEQVTDLALDARSG